MQTIAQFEVGATYVCRLIGDAQIQCRYTIAARTPKSVRTTCGLQRRIDVRDGVEIIRPDGAYSMAPTLRADRRLPAEVA